MSVVLHIVDKVMLIFKASPGFFTEYELFEVIKIELLCLCTFEFVLIP